MWLFNKPPKDILQKQYGFTVTPEFMDHLRLASISFGGASGSFISPDGLVLTNHHVGRGAVKSYVENGKKIPIQTTFAGLYEKSAKAGNKDPYELPESFLRKKPAVRMATPINFVSTADSIGGNSGSPLVNRKGEFVGVLFDGNIQSLPNRFVYEDAVSRSVMVHAQGIIEALLKIYNAKPLVDEILGRK